MYDALTSPRVYKPAIPHSKAVEMILDGQCGVFNPLLMECLTEMAPKLPEEMGGDWWPAEPGRGWPWSRRP